MSGEENVKRLVRALTAISSRIASHAYHYNTAVYLNPNQDQDIPNSPMVALMRQFLVLILIALQFAAPLVHAHIGQSAPVMGLHLHEFENLHLHHTDSFVQATLEHVACMDSAIVKLGSALKSQTSTDETMAYYHPDGDGLGPVVQPLLRVINFSPHDAAHLAAPSRNQHLSRAPPT
ncbi:hypothetical protein NP590_08440 [Methylomonas sp. SURF-2]|uniref:Uncharacterized protein n=1 Tax=Methylomonas subterranea TaxID=2952225 RepID=A0ABT1TF86_9GAMM|nr:hypothetical protein [Methylomonas sp. SURF-2]MCQ8104129.1 hypothetical protein [Methylomonas sp. SURF-2]